MSDKYKYDAASTSCDPLVKFEKSVRDFDENWALYEELTQARETIKKMAEALKLIAYIEKPELDGSPWNVTADEMLDAANQALELAKPWLEGK